MRRITARPLDADAFRPFGEVIESDNARSIRLINGGTTTRFHEVAPVEVGEGRAILSIFRGKPFAPPVAIRMMERHPLGSQAFVPLSPHPYLVVVAQDAGGRPGEPAAFMARAGQGVSYPAGAWHHPLIALEEVCDFLVVDREGDGVNLEEYAFGEGFELVLP
ncbi:ureidoglycolate lyase [Aureimonas sp. AU4]|uniref:ureidoglycolate lyase n=1 Tax=Aureimonas sp. AU4 TaxID=1638163 RepID=UPI000780379B|nr:ureidoglycolate lyase [Aureimonas sp. AU4]